MLHLSRNNQCLGFSTNLYILQILSNEKDIFILKNPITVQVKHSNIVPFLVVLYSTGRNA